MKKHFEGRRGQGGLREIFAEDLFSGIMPMPKMEDFKLPTSTTATMATKGILAFKNKMNAVKEEAKALAAASNKALEKAVVPFDWSGAMNFGLDTAIAAIDGTVDYFTDKWHDGITNVKAGLSGLMDGMAKKVTQDRMDVMEFIKTDEQKNFDAYLKEWGMMQETLRSAGIALDSETGKLTQAKAWTNAFGDLEQPEATKAGAFQEFDFNRVSTYALARQAMAIPQKQLTVAERANVILGRINAKIGQPAPAVLQ
jgi:hypothetical protein